MRLLFIAAVAAACVAGCAEPERAKHGLLDTNERPAERALLSGLRAYDGAQYVEAEKQFKTALLSGLVSPRNKALAHKHLAFIYCTSKRPDKCAVEFRSAKMADPSFALSKSEADHPLWGSVYQKALP